MDKSIVLIGFMGVGKTTIGEVLARKLGRTFVDIDREIEMEHGKTVAEIFSNIGERDFRAIERQTTIRHCIEPGKVISLGGGAFLNEEVRNVCIQNCIVVYLDLSWDSWEGDRLQKIGETRPLLQGLSVDEVKELFHRRKPMYAIHHQRLPLMGFDPERAADLVISSVYEQILSDIASEFNE